MKKLLALMLLLSVASCNSVLGRLSSSDEQRRATLPQSVEALHKALQWNSVTDAMPIVDDRYKPAFMTNMKRFQRGKITEVDIASHEFDPKVEKATVVSHIKYYTSPTFVIKDLEYKQEWAYLPMAGGWLLVGGTMTEQPIIDPDKIPNL